MKVLVACEFSGIVRDAFIARGHDATSCDLLPSDTPGPHVQGDVRPLLQQRWDLIIAHPPCTYLARSGVRWLHSDKARWAKLDDGAAFFVACLNANAPSVAVENPLPHRYAVARIGSNFTFSVQPWQFGHGETKCTCFWTRGLQRLVPTDVVGGREQRIHKMPPGPDRWKARSLTFTGIAEAMAAQWGSPEGRLLL